MNAEGQYYLHILITSSCGLETGLRKKCTAQHNHHNNDYIVLTVFEKNNIHVEKPCFAHY